MYVVAKKRSGRSESLFVFKFKDQEDADSYIGFVRKTVERFFISKDEDEDDGIESEFLNVLNKLESRIDDKYADEDSALSAGLFADEMAVFVECLSLMFAGFSVT